MALTVWRRHRQVTAATEFVALAGTIAFMCFAYAGELSATTVAGKLAWLDLRYLGICPLPVLALLLALRWGGYDRWLTGRTVAGLLLLPAVTLGFAWTNEMHHLVGGPSVLLQRDGYVLRQAEGRIVFWLFVLYAYLCVLAATVIYARGIVVSPLHRRQGLLLLVSTLLPWGASILALFLGGAIDPGYDVSHLGYAAASLGWMWALTQGRLFDLVPVARDRVFESIGDAVLVVDDASRVIDHNPAAQRVFGREAAFVGTPLAALVGEDTAGVLLSQSGAALLGRVFEVQRSVVRRARGAAATVLILRDVTDRRREEAAREEAQRLAREASRAQAQFLARMSHEVRSPLHGVVGAADLLLSAGLQAQPRRYAEAVAASSRVLLALVDELLDFSKLDAERLHAELRDVDARPLLDEVALMFSAMAQRKGIALQVDGGPPMPVRADPVRLRQVLANLVGNAVKFTDHGSVTLAAVRHGDTQRFEVRDTGVGVAPFAQAQIFEPFVQLQNSPREGPQGTGLGLAIAKRMVSLMGGQMGVASEVGQGSSFWFTLQAVEAAAGEALAPRPDRSQRAGRVLAVDDNEINRLVTEGLLQREGCTVLTAADAATALDLLAGGGIELVLTDMRMPGMDGLQFAAAARRLPASNKHLAIVALTADVHQAAREQALQAGMDDWLAKPVDPVLLRRVLDRWLPQAAAHDAPLALREYLAADAGMYRRILQAFHRATPEDMAAIEAAAQRGDVGQARDRAHALKGAALLLGAQPLADACGRLMDAERIEAALLHELRDTAAQALAQFVPGEALP